ncbi:MAG: type II secretion system protein, partial [Fimbriimonas ginsengisoli]|nr:type II secretion system protein [Fimbriimonas ginsengisoli]
MGKAFDNRMVRSRHMLGFTLVELLIVMTIIAILLGILFPVLGASIRRARKTQTDMNYHYGNNGPL